MKSLQALNMGMDWQRRPGCPHFFFVFHLWFVDAPLGILNIKAEYECQEHPGAYENSPNPR